MPLRAPEERTKFGEVFMNICEHELNRLDMLLNVKKNLVACALGNMMLNVLLYYVLTALLLPGLIVSDIWVFLSYDLVNLNVPLTMPNVHSSGL